MDSYPLEHCISIYLLLFCKLELDLVESSLVLDLIYPPLISEAVAVEQPIFLKA